jgi:hypothetical protein
LNSIPGFANAFLFCEDTGGEVERIWLLQSSAVDEIAREFGKLSILMDQETPPPIRRKQDPPPVPSSEMPTAGDGEVSSGNAAYNIVSDAVTGVNFRKSDNNFQAKWMLWGMILSSIAGTVLVLFLPRWKAPCFAGTPGGAILGMILGTLFSGIYLMIYRGARHMQGKYD